MINASAWAQKRAHPTGLQKEPENALDEFIRVTYGNPPPPKAANLEEAVRIAYEELLARNVDRREVMTVAMELNRSPIPYSTHDLAVAIAMNFFKQIERLQQLAQAQLTARRMVAQWTNEKKVVVPLAETFEDAMDKLYKP